MSELQCSVRVMHCLSEEVMSYHCRFSIHFTSITRASSVQLCLPYCHTVREYMNLPLNLYIFYIISSSFIEIA